MAKILGLSVKNSYEVYCRNHGLSRDEMTPFHQQMALLLASMEPCTSTVWVEITLGEDEEQAQEPKT
jgi:hypothetical protein